MTLGPGRTLLHYHIVEKLGEGGMGEVWRAVDTSLDRAVAIKVLPDAFAADPDRLARFEQEARLLASLNHPGIAAVHSVHAHEGSPRPTTRPPRASPSWSTGSTTSNGGSGSDLVVECRRVA